MSLPRYHYLEKIMQLPNIPPSITTDELYSSIFDKNEKLNYIYVCNHWREQFIEISNHHTAYTGKYKKFQWRDDLNFIYLNSVEAIIRHSIKMMKGAVIEPEVDRPHFNHLLGRSHMAVTSLMRLIKGDKVPPVTSYNCSNFSYKSWGENISVETFSVSRYILSMKYNEPCYPIVNEDLNLMNTGSIFFGMGLELASLGTPDVYVPNDIRLPYAIRIFSTAMHWHKEIHDKNIKGIID